MTTCLCSAACKTAFNASASQSTNQPVTHSSNHDCIRSRSGLRWLRNGWQRVKQCRQYNTAGETARARCVLGAGHSSLPMFVAPHSICNTPDKNPKTDTQQNQAATANSRVPNIYCSMKLLCNMVSLQCTTLPLDTCVRLLVSHACLL